MSQQEWRILVSGVNIGTQHVIDGQDPDRGPWWTDDLDVARREAQRLQEANSNLTFKLDPDPDPRPRYSHIPEAAMEEMGGARIEYRVRYKKGSSVKYSYHRDYDEASRFAETMYPLSNHILINRSHHAIFGGIEWRPLYREHKGGRVEWKPRGDWRYEREPSFDDPTVPSRLTADDFD